MRKTLTFYLFLTFFFCFFSQAQIISPTAGIVYVKQIATGTGNGSDWDNATADLHNAIHTIGVQKVFVAVGNYPVGNNSFTMKNGVEIYGGFDPLNEIKDLSHKRVMPNASNAQGTILNGQNTRPVIWNVFTPATVMNNTAILDGFTVIGGSYDNGGGIRNVYASPLLRNLVIRGNVATIAGGGVYNDNSSPILLNAIVSSNNVINTLAIYGAGIYNTTNSSPVLVNTTIVDNSLISPSSGIMGGAGIYSSNSFPKIYNSIIWNNTKNNSTSVSGTDIEGGVMITLKNSITQLYQTASTTDNNKVGANPLFAHADFSLQMNSPAINGGDNGLLSSYGDIEGLDLAGNLRLSSQGIDIGAYEYQIKINPTNGIAYVKPTATGSGNGSSWANATNWLQDAIDAVGTQKVFVATGNYNVGSRSFIMRNNVEIYGGFDPINGIIDLTHNRILPNHGITDGSVLNGKNERPVIWNEGNGLNNSAILDGFTLMNGYSTGDGGGVRNYAVSPTFRNLVIKNNSANRGGGMFNLIGNPLITSVIIKENSAATVGGGVFDDVSFLTNVLIVGNTAGGNGAGIYCIEQSILKNATILDDIWSDNSFTVHNSILYGNIRVYAYLLANYSLMKGYSNTQNGNISANGITLTDIFTNPSAGEYTLKYGSPAVNKGGNSYYPNLPLDTKDIINNARVFRYAANGVIDIGAYESSYNTPIVADASGVVYVKESSTGKGDGSSWVNAASDLQDAINANVTQKVYMAIGNYNAPTDGFVMKNNVAIYGGFDPANNNTNFSSRIMPTETIGGTVLNGESLRRVVNNNFILGAVLDNTAVLDGVSIINGVVTTVGAGMYNYKASPTLHNVVFRNNLATGTGSAGAIYNVLNSSPVISNALFINNSAANHAGAIYNTNSSNPLVTNAIFKGNSAGTSAVMSVLSSFPVFTNVLFTENIGSGVIWLNGSGNHVVLNNATIVNNKNIFESLANPLVLGNGATGSINNSILYGNIDNMQGYDVKYSLLEGKTGITNGNINSVGVGLIDIFKDPANGDYSLKPSSPAINTGNNALYSGLDANTKDLAGNPRVFRYNSGGYIDLGSYESQPTPLVPDINGILYVNKSINSGDANGTSWANAVRELADALEEAKTNTAIKQIWVAKGTYLPKYVPVLTDNNGVPTTDRDKTFLLVKDVKIYGGFDPANGLTELNTRNPRVALTTLSGDLGVLNTVTDNAFHVVVSAGNMASAVLDGFIVSDGYAKGSGAEVSYSLKINTIDVLRIWGAGICIIGGSPTIINIEVTNNTALAQGGGILAKDCFSFMTSVNIHNNRAEADGGGMFNANSSPIITNLLLYNNSASVRGGGMVNAISAPILTNVTISNNSNGGLLNHSGSSPAIRNSIIYGNSAYNVWNNEINADKPNVKYSLVQGSGGSATWNTAVGINGGNNKDLDPQFTDATNSNYQLKVGSPAINAGDNTLFNPGQIPDISNVTADIIGNQRILGGLIDMGGYEIADDLIPDGNGIIYVKTIATGNGTGDSWINATANLQGAINAVGVHQVWVATGMYVAQPNSLKMKNGVAIYGGFDLASGIDDISKVRVVLDGNNNRGSILSGGNERSVIANVFSAADPLNSTAILDGFTLTAGKGTDNGAGSVYGGAIYNNYASPSLRNLLITGNSASTSGGGIYSNNSSPVMSNMVIVGNTTAGRGGGFFNGRGNVSLTNVVVKGNSAEEGGGIYHFDLTANLINVEISGNTATGSQTGSAIHTYIGTNRFVNVTIAGNNGTAFYNGANNYLNNTIFYGGTNGNPYFTETKYSLIDGNGTSDLGFAITTVAPNAIFSNPTSGDYTLLSSAKVVNAGNSLLYAGLNDLVLDLAAKPRLFGAKIDLGAYELQMPPTMEIVPDANNIVYVNKTVVGGDGSGNSWSNAIPELADALKWAADNQANWTNISPLKIYIAKGVYLPKFRAALMDDNNAHTTDRDRAFVLGANMQLFGGFDPIAGILELSHSRILSTSGTIEGTILSGDLDQNDGSNFTNYDQNTYHVLVVPTASSGFVVDGVTIRGGNANGGSTTINVLGTSFSRRNGAGAFIAGNGILANSKIEQNQVLLIANSAVSGAGLFSVNNNSVYTNLLIRDNYSENAGAGVSISAGSPKFINTAIVANQASQGAGLYSSFGNITLLNCTIAYNNASANGAGLYFNGMAHHQLQVNNSIIWGNTSSDNLAIWKNLGVVTASNNLIQGGLYNSLNLDPLFSNPASGDFRLKATSPGVDKGDNALYQNLDDTTKDLEGKPRVHNYNDSGIIDMGAFESLYTAIRPDLNHIVYVKTIATGTGSGNSWSNATADLQGAIGANGVQQVWVANGTYVAPSSQSFVMKNGVAIYGGFDLDQGVIDLTHRRVIPNTGAATPISGGSVLKGSGNKTVVYNNFTGVDPLLNTAILDGFTITTGKSQYGGGINNTNASPILRNLYIKDNMASSDGGAIYNMISSPIISNVLMANNSALVGGAMSNNESSNPVLTNVIMKEHVASWFGGAVYNYNSSPLFNNTLISNNSAPSGSAVYNEITASPVFTNVTITNNTAEDESLIVNSYGSSPLIQNSIIYGNTGTLIMNFSRTEDMPVFSYSLVQGSGGSNFWVGNTGINGGYNIDMTPRFTNPSVGDYNLRVGSPAIDAGNNSLFIGVDINTKDLAGNARVYKFAENGIIDIGAYEVQTSISPQSINPIANLVKTYGSEVFEPGASATSGLTVSYASADNSIAEAYQDTADGNKWKINIKKAGTVNITASQVGDTYYQAAAPVIFSLTINKKPVNISLVATPAISKAYDSNTNATIATANLIFGSGEVVSGDELNVALSSTAAAYSTADAGTAKAVTVPLANMSLAGTAKANYSIANLIAVTANVGEITKAPITGVSLADASFVYDGSSKSLAIAGTLPAGATVSYTGNGQSNAGTYTVTASINGGANYENQTLTATLTINKAAITGVSLADASFVYDGTAKSLTITGTLPTGATVSYTNNGERNAGTYTVTANITGGANYQDQILTANLAITKAPLTITANNASMCQGSNLPSFTAIYAGFKNGETESSLSTKPNLSTTASSSSAVGTYSIIAASAVASNYEISYVNGSLSITALPVVTITSSKGNSISKGETITLTASGGTSYAWTGEGIISGQNSATLTIRPTVSGSYKVRVSNGNGCSSEQSFELTVREDFAALKATNIMSPNGDGVNDTWVVENIDMYPNNEVKIFDQAGRVIYSKRSYDNSWSGTVNGTPLVQGTYYYIIDFGSGKIQKGFITLLR